MKGLGGSCETIYISLYAKFALASGPTHKRETEYFDTNIAGRDYYYMYIRRCLEDLLGVKRSGGSCETIYISLYAKFALASGATHKRKTEYVDTARAETIIACIFDDSRLTTSLQ